MANLANGGNHEFLFYLNDKVFLIDIPRSIAVAQGVAQPLDPGLGSDIKRQLLLSCSPLKEPYPSTEPKKPSARAHVLERIPISERQYHAEVILPLVEASLQTIKAAVSNSPWCCVRAVPQDKSDTNLQDQLPRKRRREDSTPLKPISHHVSTCNEPPMILSSSSPNEFNSLAELSVVKNPSSKPATIRIRNDDDPSPYEYVVPARSNFTLCTLPLFETEADRSCLNYPIPGLSPQQKFNLILMDPPWPNRSVRRSRHYQTHHYSEMDVLTEGLRDILRVHSYDTPESQTQPEQQSQQSIAAIWITNAEKSRKAAYTALSDSGFRVCEEWIWVKTTVDGRPISALDGIWRKPYETLVVGCKDGNQMNVTTGSTLDLTSISDAVTTRRVIAAVPDLHSRKPNLKSVFERVFLGSRYSALEVFARNLTTGWWAAGNEVLRFNSRDCWVDPDSETDGNWFPI